MIFNNLKKRRDKYLKKILNTNNLSKNKIIRKEKLLIKKTRSSLREKTFKKFLNKTRIFSISSFRKAKFNKDTLNQSN